MFPSKITWALRPLLIVSLVLLEACGGGGGDGSNPTPVPGPTAVPGEGIYNTTWQLRIYEDGQIIDGGIFAIDGSGSLNGELDEGHLDGHVDADGSAAGWTVSGASGSGSLNAGTGTGSGNWQDEPHSGTWDATRL